ncbi:hypothetical protein H4219_001060 [Mycoemilia scoparia]|uniref:Methyltransferase type 11 domain-containing protein n=1 Tax=Mycoemilia scoparia TaxID=417184 RepID=A0A9W8DVV5_9FUNG|nr:hypothetical protein H4219_001060 [Mycoemilia scoparia]
MGPYGRLVKPLISLSGVSRHISPTQPLRTFTSPTKACQSERPILPQTQSIYEVFDREAKRAQRDRSASYVESSREVDYLKDEVALRLADRLLDIKRKYPLIVEIGAGCGHFAKALEPEMTKKLVMCEYSEKMLFRDANEKYKVEVERRVMNEEVPDFEPNSLDAVVSSLSMHWVNDLPGMMSKVMDSLVPDGVFIGSLFGGDTLFELRTAFQLADQERGGGIAARVSPMTHLSDIGGLMNRAGFTLSTIDVDNFTINYPSMFHLLSDINAMGEGNAVVQRLPMLKRDTLLAAAAIYNELHGNADGSIPATFQVIYFIGWKPGPDQPKPLERGSGSVSLKDALKGGQGGKL